MEPDTEAEVVAERYVLGRRLGSGRYGEVYVAHDRVLDQQVAIKLLRGISDTTPLFREAAFLRSLESPFILRVDNAGIDADIGYLATKVAASGSAEDQLPAFGLAPDRVLLWTRQTLIGLRACHEHGLVHCDIKPANIFLDEHDRAALGDFGAAQRMDDRGHVRQAGDPLVRAPEMLRGGSGQIRTDIYSVGASMYRLLSGAWPVEEPDDFSVFRQRVRGSRYKRLADLAPHLPKALTSIIRRAMSVDPTTRFASAEDMNIALGRLDLGRRPARTATHDGHVSCWADAPQTGPARETCVVEVNGRFDITTRRASGARTRITELCRSGVARVDLATELRRVLRAD